MAAHPGARRVAVDPAAIGGRPAQWAARILGGLAGVLLVLPMAALLPAGAQATDFVPVSTIETVAEVVRLPDGSVRLELTNGSSIVIPADGVQVTAAGEVLISIEAFDTATAAIVPIFGPGFAGLGAGAAALATGGGGTGGGEAGAGHVVDGYIVDAQVFRDLDLDGILDAGEPTARTGADGSFDLGALPGTGPLIATGGYDLTTGQAFEGRMTASDGATVITPLTTMVQSLVEARADAGTPITAADAETLLRGQLGLGSGSLLTRDPMAEAEDGNPEALAAAARIMNVLHVAEALGADVDSLDRVSAYLADALATAAAGTDPLASATVITAALNAGLEPDSPLAAQLGTLLAEAAAMLGPDAGIETIEDVQETVAVTLAEMIRNGDTLPATFGAITDDHRPFTPYLDGFDGFITATENTAGVQVSGHSHPGATIRVTIDGQEATAIAGADGAWTATFAAGAFDTEGSFTVQAVAERVVDGVTLTSRAVTQDVAIDLAAATIGGDTTGAVTEDATEGTITTSGTLTITDTGPRGETFVAQSSASGTYGTFTLAENGAWTYSAANGQDAIQSLGAGAMLTDSFTAVAADGTTQAVTVTITGTNDAPVIGGVTTGAMTEDANLTGGNLTASGALTITDPDAGQSGFVPQASASGTYGTFTLDAAGNWTYAADNAQTAIQGLAAGATLTDSFTARSADGTEQQVTVTITGTNDAATITGNTASSVIENVGVTGGNLHATGSLDISDADAGQAAFIAQVGTEGSNGYGTFTLDADGTWTYTASNSQTAIQNLAPGQSLTDSFTALSVDGTARSVTVTIHGHPGTPDGTPIIGGNTTALVIEDANLTAGNLTAAGTLTIVDTDPGQSSFVAQTSASGAYGTFTLDTSGNWTYAADNSQAAIQGLGAGATLTDTLTATSADGTTTQVTVTIRGTNDAAVITGTSTGTVIEGTHAGATGSLTVADADAGEAVFQVQTSTRGDYGAFSITEGGNWTYVLDGRPDLSIGEQGTETFTVASADGTTQQVTLQVTATGAVSLSDIEDGRDAGFIIAGTSNTYTDLSRSDRTGWEVSSAGDVNGDGLDDVIIGAPLRDTTVTKGGAAYVVYGTTDNAPVSITEIEAGSDRGFRIAGKDVWGLAGHSVSGAGDVNGDGIDDLIVGVYNAGAPVLPGAYVVFGQATNANLSLSQVGGGANNGFFIRGLASGDNTGWAVSGAGDVNGDGLADLIVGAQGDDGGGANAGAAYVVFGKTGGATVALSDLAAGSGGGFAIRGMSAGDSVASRVADVGDVNGDGLADVFVSATGADVGGFVNAGKGYVVFGKADGTAVDLSTIDAGEGGMVFEGFGAFSGAGVDIANAGDVNGDGVADMIVGINADRSNPTGGGAAYVVYGGQGQGNSIDLGDVGSTIAGLRIMGAFQTQQTGISVDSAGDVNGDGLMDLLIGAPDATRATSGSAYVVFGRSDNATLQVSDIARGEGGFVIQGASTGDAVGWSVSAAGDVNGDGFADLVVGGYEADLTGTGSQDGAAYVIYGGNLTGAVTQVGTAAADALTGTAAAEGFTGGLGNDTITGGGGADMLAGGAGDDLLIVGDTGFARVDGGRGVDTLRMGGADQMLDLAGPAGQRMAGIERIDLDGDGNTLRLSGADLLRVTGGGALRVLGTGANEVTLAGTGWRAAGTVTDGDGSFDVFTDGAARIEIQSGIGRNGGPIDPVELSDTAGGADFTIFGAAAGNAAGAALAAAGDVNGDGLGDLIVSGTSGDSHVVFGSAQGSDVALSSLGSGGLTITGGAGSVAGAGDVNGDGLADVVIGTGSAAHVVFGRATGGSVDLANPGSGGFTIAGATGTVAAAGDVNADGLADVFVSDGTDGHVVFGRTDGAAVDLTALGSGGFRVAGATGPATGVGDVNGDGLDDLLVGTGGNSHVVFGQTGSGAVTPGTGLTITGASAAGAAAGDVNGDGLADLFVSDGTDSYVFFGQTGTGILALSDYDIRIAGGAGTLAGLGDVDGDGFDDLMIGQQTEGAGGSAYVIFGREAGGTIQLSDIAAGHGGVAIHGAASGDAAGAAVSAAGDLNGDGFADLVIGAPGAGAGDAGAAHVIYGTDATGAVAHIGTDGADVLTGSRIGESLIGGRGNDTITGGGGADVLIGGAGDDRFILTDLALRQIDGGTGTDTVELAGSRMRINLADSAGDAVTGVERVDLGNRDNRITVSEGDVARLSGSSNTLRVLGGETDSIDLSTGQWTLAQEGWQDGGQSFDVYTSGQMRLEVQTGIENLGTPVAAIQLSAVAAGTSGFVMQGTNELDYVGIGVVGGGDVNGDGLADVMVLSLNRDLTGERDIDNGIYGTGAAYVVFGASGNSALDLTTLETGTSDRGFLIAGVSPTDRLGWPIDMDDVNGDGLADLIITASTRDVGGVEDAGAAYVVFGKTGGARVDLSDIEAGTGSQGFMIAGYSNMDRAGNIRSAGDVNGDGRADLIVGAPGRGSAAGATEPGAYYVVLGKAGGARVDLSEIDAGGSDAGFTIRGQMPGDLDGFAFNGVGDINGDGYDDLLVSSYLRDVGGVTDAGASYLVFGGSDTANLELSAIEAGTSARGFMISGGTAGERFGNTISSAGDINGDGYDDLFIGSEFNDTTGANAGGGYVVFGGSAPAAVDLADIRAGQGGFAIYGADGGDSAGRPVGLAGDVNGDGLDDLLVGSFLADRDGEIDPGVAYVVFGKTDGDAVYLSDVEAGWGGFAIRGQDSDNWTGWQVEPGGDMNGDGFADVLVSAPRATVDGVDNAGRAYVVYGGNFTGDATTGTEGADQMTGTAADDVLFAGRGDDTLIGGGGTDRLSGGWGADRFVIGDVAGQVTVVDFDADQGDVIDLSAFVGLDLQGVQALLDPQAGGDVRIALDADTTLLIADGFGSALQSDWFVFAQPEV